MGDDLYGQDQSASAFPGSRQSSRQCGSPRIKAAGQGLDTPRMFEDDVTQEEERQIELGEVKRERQILMQSIAGVKQDAGTAGGEAQQNDIKQLMKVNDTTMLQIKISQLELYSFLIEFLCTVLVHSNDDL